MKYLLWKSQKEKRLWFTKKDKYNADDNKCTLLTREFHGNIVFTVFEQLTFQLKVKHKK